MIKNEDDRRRKVTQAATAERNKVVRKRSRKRTLDGGNGDGDNAQWRSTQHRSQLMGAFPFSSIAGPGACELRLLLHLRGEERGEESEGEREGKREGLFFPKRSDYSSVGTCLKDTNPVKFEIKNQAPF